MPTYLTLDLTTGIALRAARLRHGLSQGQLAVRMGVAQSNIYQLEQRSTITPKMQARIRAILEQVPMPADDSSTPEADAALCTAYEELLNVLARYHRLALNRGMPPLLPMDRWHERRDIVPPISSAPVGRSAEEIERRRKEAARQSYIDMGEPVPDQYK